MQAVFNAMRFAYGAVPVSPKSPSNIDNGQVPAPTVDPVLLRNFLAETHQVDGCTCTFCAFRDEQAQTLENTQNRDDTHTTSDTPSNDNTRPHDTQPTSEAAPTGTTTILHPPSAPDANSTPDLTSTALPTVPEETPPTTTPRDAHNMATSVDVPIADRPRSRSLSISRHPPSHSRGSRLGLGITFPPRSPSPTAHLSATLDDLPGPSLPGRHFDIVPTPLPEQNTISLNSPPPQSHIHSPDPQAYIHHGRRHPNFTDTTLPTPHPPTADGYYDDFPIPSSPHHQHHHHHPRHTTSLRAPAHHHQPRNPRAYADQPLPSDDDLPPPPRYTRRDHRRAPLFLQRDMEAYFNIDPAALGEALPVYSTHDPLLVQAHRRRLRGHGGRAPLIEGFQEAALRRPSSGSSGGGGGGVGGGANAEGREGAQQGFAKFVASLLRGTARFCSLIDPTREGPVERGYGVDRRERVPMDVLRRELERQERLQAAANLH